MANNERHLNAPASSVNVAARQIDVPPNHNANGFALTDGDVLQQLQAIGGAPRILINPNQRVNLDDLPDDPDEEQAQVPAHIQNAVAAAEAQRLQRAAAAGPPVQNVPFQAPGALPAGRAPIIQSMPVYPPGALPILARPEDIMMRGVQSGQVQLPPGFTERMQASYAQFYAALGQQPSAHQMEMLAQMMAVQQHQQQHQQQQQQRQHQQTSHNVNQQQQSQQQPQPPQQGHDRSNQQQPPQSQLGHGSASAPFHDLR